MTTNDLPDCRVGDVTGPIRKRPSGKFTLSGEPVLRKCAPYWVVRYLHGSVLQDAQFPSRAAAEQFWGSLAPSDLVGWGGTRG